MPSSRQSNDDASADAFFLGTATGMSGMVVCAIFGLSMRAANSSFVQSENLVMPWTSSAPSSRSAAFFDITCSRLSMKTRKRISRSSRVLYALANFCSKMEKCSRSDHSTSSSEYDD